MRLPAGVGIFGYTEPDEVPEHRRCWAQDQTTWVECSNEGDRRLGLCAEHEAEILG